MSDQAEQEHAIQVKRRHEQELLRKANVVAVGVGYCARGGAQIGEIGIILSVESEVPSSTLYPAMILARRCWT